jgi:hypothetical protein
VADGGVADAGVADGGVADAGVADAGLADAGLADAGLADAGLADGGAQDSTDAGETKLEPASYRVGCDCMSGASGFAECGVILCLIATLRVRRRKSLAASLESDLRRHRRSR